MAPDIVQLTSMRFEKIPPYLLGQFYFCGGNGDAISLITDLHYSAERIFNGCILRGDSDKIAYFTFVTRKEFSAEGNDSCRVPVRYPATRRADQFVPFPLLGTIIVIPAFVAEHRTA